MLLEDQQVSISKLQAIMMKTTILLLSLFLSFKSVLGQPKTNTPLATGWYIIKDDSFPETIPLSTRTSPVETYYIFNKTIIESKSFKTIEYASNTNPRLNGIRITLDKEGKEKWSRLTKESIGLNLGLIVNGRLEYVWHCDHQTDNGIIYITTIHLPERRLKELAEQLRQVK
jgi:preprotein translocase subunit SecD